MKGQRHTTEEKIRILREADSGRNINEVCKDRNISEVTLHRWKREFGLMDITEAKRLKELECENSELKKMLTDSLLKSRVLEAINTKNGEHRAQATDGCLRRCGGLFSRRAVCRYLGLSRATYRLSGAIRRRSTDRAGGAYPGLVGGPPAFWLLTHRGAAAPRKLVRELQAR